MINETTKQAQTPAPGALIGAPLDRPFFVVLTVRGGSERVAREVLRDGGVDAWFPVVRNWVSTGGRGRRRKFKTYRAAISGYVVARFDGQPRWHMILREGRAAQYVTGIVGAGGRPVALRQDEIEALAGMGGASDGDAVGIAQATFDRAERVDVVDGPFAGLVCEVDRVSGAVAHLLVDLFGRQTPASVPLASIKKVLDNPKVDT